MMTRQLLDLEVTRVDLVDEGANSEAHIKIFKNKEGGRSDMDFKAVLEKMKPEHAKLVEAEVTKAAAVVPEATAQEILDLTKAVGDSKAAEAAAITAKEEAEAKLTTTEEDDDTILKNVDPKVRSIIEKARLQAKAAEEAVKKVRDEADDREALTKAKEIPNVGADEDKLSTVFKSLKKIDNELFTEVFGILKAADEAIKEGGLFEEFGKNKGAEDGAEAWNAIEKKAESIAVAKSITKEAAISEVVKDHPELYEAYVASQE